ncbi:MFS transporter [Streptomyces xiaopingdaonensis]|uniref:MFS transporter n=1 Tax=Streptomyces xiaopingdaonensis TaxID=1565415 RepID=UPI000373B0C3|nr:MFS transporter [Streptomyces xiaopingdaonensis]
MGGATLKGEDAAVPASVEVSLEFPEQPSRAEEHADRGRTHGDAPPVVRAATVGPWPARPAEVEQPTAYVPKPGPGPGLPAEPPARVEAGGPSLFEERPEAFEGVAVAARPPTDGGGPEESGSPAGLSLRRVRLAFLGLMLAMLLAAMEQTIVATALPKIVGELHGLDKMSWVVTAFLLASTIVLPVYGKLGDLLGRKGVFQFAIVVFVAGSALAGWSPSMDWLILFRAVQGVGAGGLMIGVQAIIADIVPPPRRARYMGLITGAFGLSSVAGPLLGGWLTDEFSWRWCFYFNVPLGALTFLVTAVVLKLPPPGGRPRLDVLGTLLLASFSTCLVLLTTWGGTEYAWDDRVILGLGGGAAVSGALFVLVEHRSREPILPLRLFRNSVFNLTGLVGAAVGVALFGAASYLPTFLQMVEGVTATESGLLMLPLMGGVVLASALSGQLISRTGHYRVFPVLGCLLSAEGMWLLSRLDSGTTREVYSLWMGILGLGVGFVLPVLILAVQNSVPASQLGTATSAHNYFRQIGGSVGAAIFGTLFAQRLTDALEWELPSDRRTDLPDPGSLTPELVHGLPSALREAYVSAYAEAMPRIFLYLVPVLVLGLLLACFLKEKPLVSQNVSVPAARTSEQPAAPPEPAAHNGSGVPVCGSVRHHDGTGVPRAALTLVDTAGRQVGRGATGEDGRYALSTPGGGAYVLIASAGGHQPRAVSVSVGERPVEVDVVLGGAGRLAGAVLTADGQPVQDATVTLTDVRGEVVASTRSGREGSYVITELVAGEYTLAASAPVHRPAALPVSVQASRETRQDIELAGGAVLRGTVRATGGRPVEDARVTLLDAAGNVVDTATTGADGAFRFVDLSSGEYTVIAAGYPPVATVLQVAGGGRMERDLQLGHED